jgi:hypothetical protein
MWETRSVQLSVRLPRDIAAQAEEVQRTDPDFLSRVVLYGLTRRSIYRHLRETDILDAESSLGAQSEEPRLIP